MSLPPSVLARVSILALALCGALCALAIASATASAATGFKPVGSVAALSADGAADHLGDIAVNDATGDVYKVDLLNHQVVVYAPTASGADELTSFGGSVLSAPHGIAVDQASGAVVCQRCGQRADRQVLVDGQPTPSFTRDLSFTSPTPLGRSGAITDFHAALAVDASGKLFVADPGTRTVKQFQASGAYDGFTLDGTGSGALFTRPIDVAVDSTGDLLVVDADGDIEHSEGSSRVEQFSSLGVWEDELGPLSRPASVAVRPATDDVVVSSNQDAVYRDQSPAVDVFDPSGNAFATVALDPAASKYDRVKGIAIDDGADGRLYVALDAGSYAGSPYGDSSIQAFAPAQLADLTIDPVTTSPTSISPHVTGTVNPHGAPTSVYAEYSTDGNSWTATPSQDAGDGNSAVAVDILLTGLAEQTSYQVRLVADRDGAVGRSGAEPFTTGVAAQPTVTIDEPTNLTATSADISGTVNPRGSATSYYIEVSQDEMVTWNRAPGDSGADHFVGAGTTPVAVQTTLTDLAPVSEYFVRIVASNGVRTATAQTFVRTLPASPIVATGEASAIGYSKATLNGMVDGQGADATSYWFEYGTDTTYGQRWTPLYALGSARSSQLVSAPLAGLRPATTYHFRVAADNRIGISYGVDQTFTTADGPPAFTGAEATDIGARSVMLQARVLTSGHAGASRFYVTTDSSPDTRVVAAQDLPASSTSTGISARVDGLAPGTTYRFRAAVTTSTGTGFSEEQTFTTAGAADREVVPFAGGSGVDAFGCRGASSRHARDRDPWRCRDQAHRSGSRCWRRADDRWSAG